MKKIIIILVITLVIVSTMFYIYYNYKADVRQAKIENMKYEQYKDKEITGLELATVINKAIDQNEKNKINKNNKGIYIDNKQNSINIDIKFIDNDEVYNMETIYKSKIENFISYYRLIKFKCVKIEYHDLTKKIKQMKFEQITQ